MAALQASLSACYDSQVEVRSSAALKDNVLGNLTKINNDPCNTRLGFDCYCWFRNAAAAYALTDKITTRCSWC